MNHRFNGIGRNDAGLHGDQGDAAICCRNWEILRVSEWLRSESLAMMS